MLDKAPLQLVPGTVIFDQYQIVKLLGVGSAGFVYLCQHKALSGYPLAIKVFFRNRTEEIDVERFRREIGAAYDVNHPNVIRCYEYLCAEGLMAFTMEYLSGGNLAQKMLDPEFRDYPKLVSTLISICAGLEAIHRAGIVHRDLKPENVLISAEGQIKIADFSIAHNTCAPRLDTDGVLGTIDYISPEYMSDGIVDERTDIYALGVIAYEMITGKVPCQGKNPYHTLRIRMEHKAEPVGLLRKDCPKILQKIVMKALEREPRKRYRSAQAMLGDLKKLSDVLSRQTFLETQGTAPSVEEVEDYPRVVERTKRMRVAGEIPSPRGSSYIGRLEVVSFCALIALFGVSMAFFAGTYFF
jgi:serine/threonine-protein kinase